MSPWISVKRGLRNFYSAWEAYVRAAAKFLLACGLFWGIGAAVGNHPFLSQPAAIVLAGALCSILPANALIIGAAVYLEAGFWQTSLVSGLVGAVVLLAVLLFYFCFIPGRTWALVCAGLGLGLGVPFCVPVACGLLGGGGGLVGISLGTFVYYLSLRLAAVPSGTAGLGADTLDAALELFGTVFLDQEMIITLVILAAVCLVVFLIRRMPVSHCWIWATAAGAVVYGALRALEFLFLGAVFSLPLLGADLLLGIGTGLALKSFCFSLDYRKVQHLQFEDDEYYYYVKAVPKLDLPADQEEDQA